MARLVASSDRYVASNERPFLLPENVDPETLRSSIVVIPDGWDTQIARDAISLALSIANAADLPLLEWLKRAQRQLSSVPPRQPCSLAWLCSSAVVHQLSWTFDGPELPLRPSQQLHTPAGVEAERSLFADTLRSDDSGEKSRVTVGRADHRGAEWDASDGGWEMLKVDAIERDELTAEQARVQRLREARWGDGGELPEEVRLKKAAVLRRKMEERAAALKEKQEKVRSRGGGRGLRL